MYIGIDIGGTNFRVAAIGDDGSVEGRIKELSRIDEGRNAFCTRLLDSIRRVEADAARRGGRLEGIGIGVPGLVTRDGVITSSVNMTALDGYDLARHVREQTGVPVHVGNDANMIAVGEHRFGAGRGMHSLAVLTIGTGLGSGLVLEDRLWTGAGGFAAEFGHLTLVPDGLPCACGNRGCLEQYVSAGALVRGFARLLSPDEQGGVTAELVAGLARQGDVRARESVSALGRSLGIAVATLVNTLNLEGVVVAGGVAECLELFELPLRDELERRCFPQMLQGFRLLRGALGDDAGLLGAVAMLM